MHLCLTALLCEYSLYFPPGAIQSTLPAGTELPTPLCSLPSSMGSREMRWQGIEAASCHRQQKEHLRQTWLHPALTWWTELHCAWALLVPTHPVKQCLHLVFPQEDACHCLCGMEQRRLHPCSGSSPRPDTVVNTTLLLLLVLYDLDLRVIPVPLGCLGLSRGAEIIP